MMMSSNRGRGGRETDEALKWILGGVAVGGLGLLGYYIYQRAYAQPAPPPPPPPSTSPLSISLSADRTSINTGESVTFSVSWTGGSAPYSYRLVNETSNNQTVDSLSNTSSTSRSVTVRFDTAGTYTFRAYVQDSTGGSASSTSVTVTVSAATPSPAPSPAPAGTISAYTRDSYYSAVLNAIKNAKSSIYAHMYLVELDNDRAQSLLDALIDASTTRRIPVRFSFTAVGAGASTADVPTILNYMTSKGFPSGNIKVISSRAKVLLIDPVIDVSGTVTSGTVFIGTNNWTKQSLTGNEEFNIVTTYPHIADAAYKFLNMLWSDQKLSINTTTGVETQFITDTLKDRLVAAIDAATTRLYMTMNYTDFNPDNPTSTPNTAAVIDAILRMKQRAPNADIRLLLDRTFPSTVRSYLASRLAGSVKVLPSSYFTTAAGILHAKTFLVDNKCFVSSQNLANNDLVGARGATIRTTSADVRSIYLNWFGSMWNAATTV